ncbi:putative pentatricopeptide repeat-containing protein At5g47460 [Aristolochia californica]|uniref:putative pentatricopeptide repeat-containing protein At5g47460 n=1 Tax=Aristolochia californica TaxID=171875 RepID=UPI0035D7884D
MIQQDAPYCRSESIVTDNDWHSALPGDRSGIVVVGDWWWNDLGRGRNRSSGPSRGRGWRSGSARDWNDCHGGFLGHDSSEKSHRNAGRELDLLKKEEWNMKDMEGQEQIVKSRVVKVDSEESWDFFISPNLITSYSAIDIILFVTWGLERIHGELSRREASQFLSQGARRFSHFCSLFNDLVNRHNAGDLLDAYAFVQLIVASTHVNSLCCAHQVHSYVLKSGFQSNVFISTSLVNVYVKLGHRNEADEVFDEMPHRNIVSWNSLISGFVQRGEYLKAVSLVLKLGRSGLRPDTFTFSAALTACAQLSFSNLGRSVHCAIIIVGVEFNNVVGNCLIDMYGKCGFVNEAIQAFQEMEKKDVISWNSVIGAAARNQYINVAVDLLLQMPDPDAISYNELISSIAQFGDMEVAKRILSDMPNPNSSSWNSIIAGYVKRNRAPEAMELFREMHSQDVLKDQFTFSSILKGAASLSALNWGALMHSCSIKSGFDSCVIVGSALIDMYSKCADVKAAETIFGLLPRRNLVSWNAMLSGYAHNWKSKEVVRLFEQMKTERTLKPNGITFTSLLSACAQDSQLLNDGVRYFESMTCEYGIVPSAELCSCMISLLGQKGAIEKAEMMIHDLGLETCGLVWRALLGASKARGDLRVAEVAASKVIELEGDDEFVYILLSNMYASQKRWSDVSRVRALMREKGVRKRAGCSSVEVQIVVQ